jgi:Ankyrin repeats (3 copies)
MKVQIKFSEIAILLVVSLMSFAANLPDSILGNMVDKKVLLATLTAFVVIAMCRYLRMMLIVAISILAIGANLPAELASALGISQLALIVSLGFLVTVSLLNYAFRLLPMGIEEPEVPAPAVDEARHAMLAAISKGDLATLHQLLAMNVDVNFVLDGTTPIHLATEKGYSEIVRILIRHGANFRAKDAEGRRPLEIALTKRFVRTTEILFEANKPYFANPEQTVNWRMNAGVWRDAEEPGGIGVGQA